MRSMLFSLRGYRPLNKVEEPGCNPPKWYFGLLTSSAFFTSSAILASLIFILVGFFCGTLARNDLTLKVAVSSTWCSAPPVRREWRSLSRLDKEDYFSAVKCLKTRPSRIGMNHSLYEDFPWIHTYLGDSSHGKAGFLPWHRYFIQTYENALREQCGYGGQLPYWNWELDWDNVPSSPVFNSDDGFGGDGNGINKTINLGSCIKDGPFTDFEVLYYKKEKMPHCLSRGFLPAKIIEKICIPNLRPDTMSTVIRQSNFWSFSQALEEGPHIGIPCVIRGDFGNQTAPNDPLWWLHHSQLDRLWWQWQNVYEYRVYEYISPVETYNISLSDWMRFGGLASDVQVFDIMNTESGKLCYRY